MELKLVPYSAALFDLEQLFSSFDSFMARVTSKSPVCRRAAFCRKHFKFRTSCRTGPLHAPDIISALFRSLFQARQSQRTSQNHHLKPTSGH